MLKSRHQLLMEYIEYIENMNFVEKSRDNLFSKSNLTNYTKQKYEYIKTVTMNGEKNGRYKIGEKDDDINNYGYKNIRISPCVEHIKLLCNGSLLASYKPYLKNSFILVNGIDDLENNLILPASKNLYYETHIESTTKFELSYDVYIMNDYDNLSFTFLDIVHVDYLYSSDEKNKFLSYLPHTCTIKKIIIIPENKIDEIMLGFDFNKQKYTFKFEKKENMFVYEFNELLNSFETGWGLYFKTNNATTGKIDAFVLFENECEIKNNQINIKYVS